MAADDVVRADADEVPLTDPRPLLLAGLTLAGVGFTVFRLPRLVNAWTGFDLGAFALAGAFWTFLQVALLVVGAVLLGSAVAVKPKSPRLLLAAAFGAWLVGAGFDPEWDSARLVMLVLAGVALAAAFLVALPDLAGRLFAFFAGPAAQERGRFAGWVLSRAVVSLLVVLHFVGIVATVLAAPLPGRDASWLARWVWSEWQPYLQFAYLDNSYRFYSPEPGPPTLLWFYVEYTDADGHPAGGRWVKLPTREEHAKDPFAQEFTRRLSLGESITHPVQLSALPEPIKANRLKASQVAAHPELPLEAQYQMPRPDCQRNLSEYARFAAQHFPPDDPRLKVRAVKIYRVIHTMLEPRLMATGKFKPTEEWTYLPYYQGRYNSKGELMEPYDPLLFWLIPVHAWPRGKPLPGRFETTGPLPLERAGELDVIDYLAPHANPNLKPGEVS